MNISKENVLSIIGSGKYQSCILTAFSFDFYYFEMKVMKWLRSCGVRNVNVFIDGHLYSDLMNQSMGDEMSFNPGYALYPVFSKGLFHPKVWMLFGKTEGLLIIGSGNLTSSGLGGNDELWGAFHFDIKNNNNQAIFSAAWQYISRFTSNTNGLIKEKSTKWIYDYSPWLKELNPVDLFRFHKLNENEEVAFLYNETAITIWQQLLNLVGGDTVTEITAISPFYDREGTAILALKNAWQNAEINIVVDEAGTLPYEISDTSGIHFYGWQSAEKNIGTNRLHAKLLHFKTNTNTEYCLFGSANISAPGLGLAGVKFPNEEASILIKSNKGKILNNLGINLKSSPSQKIADFKIQKNISIYQSVIKENKFNTRLLFAEKDFDSITIYPEKEVNDNFVIQAYNTYNQVVFKKDIDSLTNPLSIKFSGQNIHTIQLFNKNGTDIVSNKILVHDYFTLSKTHPNPQTEDIETIVNEIQSGDLHRVVDLLHYVIMDTTENEIENERNKLGTKSKQTPAESEQLEQNVLETYNLSDYQAKDVNQILRHKSVLLSPSLRILDVLKTLNYGVFNKFTGKGINEDEQNEDISDLKGNELDEIEVEGEITFKQLNNEKTKLRAYLNRLADYYYNLLYSPKKQTDYKVTLTDLAKYVIALELLYEYGGKVENYTESGTLCYFDFIPNKKDSDYLNNDVKGYILNIIGVFQYLALQGFKEYEFEYTKQKMEQLKQEAIVLSVFIINNIKWDDNELHYQKLLILNSLHALGWSDYDRHDLFRNEIVQKIVNRKDISKRLQPIYNQNFILFENVIVGMFRQAMQNKLIKAFEEKVYKNDIILTFKFGFTLVASASKSISGYQLKLIRPGFIWNDAEQEFIPGKYCG